MQKGIDIICQVGIKDNISRITNKGRQRANDQTSGIQTDRGAMAINDGSTVGSMAFVGVCRVGVRAGLGAGLG